MAKQIGELTVGVVTKVMKHVGYTIRDKVGGAVRSKFIFNTQEEAEEWCRGNEFVEIKPVYIEEN